MGKELNISKYGSIEISTEHLSNCYFHPLMDTSIDQNDPFESALSSIVSSPIASSSNGGGDGMMIRELIGRLGSICDDDHSENENATGNNSTNTSCYSTPLDSPSSKFDLSSLMLMGNYNTNQSINSVNYPIQQKLESFNQFSWFCGGGNAANLAEFRGENSNNINNNNNINININNNNNNAIIKSVAKLENGRLSRVNSEKKLGENGDSRESSSVSEQNPGVEIGVKDQNDDNSRKRKSVSRTKVKDNSNPAKNDKVDLENEELNAKKSKVEEKKENAGELKEKEKEKENNNNSNNKEASKAEPQKDYIHVRARRGQATDSHSLAERVRREKISERMKFLQDLVPGCNKVTGKATVLDEIINYVQSLQQQVEFLSMKLAVVNPRMELNMETLVSKDMLQSRLYTTDQNSGQAFPFAYQPTQQMSLPLQNAVSNGMNNHLSANPLSATGVRRYPAVPLPSIDGLIDSLTQLPTLWEDDLQSIVQMGIMQNQTIGTIPNSQMKIEL